MSPPESPPTPSAYFLFYIGLFARFPLYLNVFLLYLVYLNIFMSFIGCFGVLSGTSLFVLLFLPLIRFHVTLYKYAMSSTHSFSGFLCCFLVIGHIHCMLSYQWMVCERRSRNRLLHDLRYRLLSFGTTNACFGGFRNISLITPYHSTLTSPESGEKNMH